MATNKSKNKSNSRPTTAERAVERMADFVERVVSMFGVDLANGKITKKTYEEVLVKCEEIFKEVEYLWKEVECLEGLVDEQDSDSKDQMAELTAYYENLFEEFQRESEQKLEDAYKTGAENLNAVYLSFEKSCDEMKKHLDENHLAQQVNELKIKLQDKTAEASQARVDAEYAESVAYEEYTTRKAMEEAYANCKKQRDRFEAQLKNLQKKNQIKSKTTVRTANSYERAQKRIAILERELSLVNDKIDGIKRNLIQSLLCEEFELPSDASYGIERAKALRKGMKKAKRAKTYETKIQNVANKLTENYPDWFVEDAEISEELNNASKAPKTSGKLYCQVESTIKSTIYVAPTLLKTGSILLFSGLIVVSSLLWINTNANEAKTTSLNNQINQQHSVMAEKDKTISSQIDYTQGLESDLSDTQQKLEETQQKLEDLQVQEKQDFVVEASSANAKVVEMINRRAKGTVNDISFSYNAKTGDLIMTALVEKEGRTTLVVGECVMNTACKLDAESVQQYISYMLVKAYDHYDEESGIYYNVTNVKNSMSSTCKIEGCKVEYDNAGTIADVFRSSYTKTAKSINQQAIVDTVVSDILSQTSQIVNE